jgi:hypothetical protein
MHKHGKAPGSPISEFDSESTFSRFNRVRLAFVRISLRGMDLNNCVLFRARFPVRVSGRAVFNEGRLSEFGRLSRSRGRQSLQILLHRGK